MVDSLQFKILSLSCKINSYFRETRIHPYAVVKALECELDTVGVRRVEGGAPKSMCHHQISFFNSQLSESNEKWRSGVRI